MIIYILVKFYLNLETAKTGYKKYPKIDVYYYI